MATNKTVTPPKKKVMKNVIHRCNQHMYIVPAQDYYPGEVDSYEIFFTSDYGVDKPATVGRSNYKFCPYCGESLYQIEEI